MKTETVKLSAIILDGGTQSRVKINHNTVQEYADALAAGDTLPPVKLLRDVDGKLYLWDGFHRTEASILAGLKKIEAEIEPGTQREAVLRSLGANTRHGLRRSNDDKRKAVMTMLTDPEWGQYSASWIAEIVGVSDQFVTNVTVEAASNGWKLSDTVLAKDGKRYPREMPKKPKVYDPSPVASPPTEPPAPAAPSSTPQTADPKPSPPSKPRANPKPQAASKPEASAAAEEDGFGEPPVDPEVLDEAGNVIPPQFAAQYVNAREAAKEFLAAVKRAEELLKAAVELPSGGRFAAVGGDVQMHLANAKKLIKHEKPYSLCPHCNGRKCKVCHRSGIANRMLHDQPRKEA